MDIEGLFSILWDATVIIAILTFALGFIYIAMGQRGTERKD
jgi:hypothetical protein